MLLQRRRDAYPACSMRATAHQASALAVDLAVAKFTIKTAAVQDHRAEPKRSEKPYDAQYKDSYQYVYREAVF